MKHPKEVQRLFNRSDEEMLQLSEVQLVSFIANKSSFVVRFPQFADPFSLEWANAIAAARGIMPDYVSVANQSNQTEALEALMEKGRDIYRTLILCAKLAFPNDASILHTMGNSKYNTASRNHLKFPVLLRTAYDVASKPEYKAALLSHGLKENELNELKTLSSSIVDQTVLQQNAKIERSLDLDLRVTTMNAVWEKMSLVCQCAKLIFQNDAARYELFKLSEGTGAAPKPVEAPVAIGAEK